MVIAKKVLYLLSGLLKVIVGGFVFLIAALIVLLKGLFRTVLNTDQTIVTQMIDGMAEASSDYAYLQAYTHTEKVDYVLGVTTRFGLVVALIAAIWIVLAVLLFIHCKRISRDDNKKNLSIIYTITSWVISPLAISTILTTIATCLRRRKGAESRVEIEAYQE